MTASGGARPLGRRLSVWREAQRLSLTAAARRLGVHPSTYQRWEEGRRPYPRHLKTIAGVLGEDLATVTALAEPAPQRLGRPAPADASVLTNARLAAGLNRVQLGRALHVGPATVYQWERGKTRPPEDLLPALAHHLDLTCRALDDALADHPPSRYDGEVLPGLGEALRRCGRPRTDVQELLGVAPTTVFEWETGRTRVPTWALRRLAAAVGTEVEDLVACGRQQPRRPAPESTLAALRHRVQMTQREAATVLGLSASSLGRYETGRRPIGLPLARAMAQAYRVPLSRVLAAAGLALPLMLVTPVWTRDQLPAILADLRHAAGASISEVARCAGVSHPTVRRWETGESVPSAGALARLEVRYGLGRGRLTSLGPWARGSRCHRQPVEPLSAGPITTIPIQPTASEEDWGHVEQASRRKRSDVHGEAALRRRPDLRDPHLRPERRRSRSVPSPRILSGRLSWSRGGSKAPRAWPHGPAPITRGATGLPAPTASHVPARAEGKPVHAADRHGGPTGRLG